MPEDRPSSVRGRVRRKLLVDKGIMVKQDDGFVFSRDHEFTSPSLAAAAVRGGASNGLTAWKTKSGKKLKEIEVD